MEHLLSCKGLTEQEAEFAIKRATKGNPGFVQTDVDDLTVRFSMSKHLPVSSRIAKVSLIENVNEVVGVAIVDGYDVLGDPEV